MKRIALLVTFLFVLAMTPSHARDAAAGKLKAAQVCNVCHGVNGMSTQPNAPNVAGQPSIYTIEQLKAYRSGKRQHEVMAVIAKSLSDDDISNLATWYESIKITAEIPK